MEPHSGATRARRPFAQGAAESVRRAGVRRGRRHRAGQERQYDVPRVHQLRVPFRRINVLAEQEAFLRHIETVAKQMIARQKLLCDPCHHQHHADGAHRRAPQDRRQAPDVPHRGHAGYATPAHHHLRQAFAGRTQDRLSLRLARSG